MNRTWGTSTKAIDAGISTIVDAVPKNATPAAIAVRYEKEKDRPTFDLTAFVYRHFSIPRQARVPGADGSGCGRG